MSDIEYTLKFEAPYFVGTGRGGPGIDLAILKDSRGLLYISRKSLRGLMSQSVWNLCRLYVPEAPTGHNDHPLWCCDGEFSPSEGKYLCGTKYAPSAGGHCPVCRLFGQPGGFQGALDLSAARYDPTLRAQFDDALKDMQTTTRSHNSIDKGLRRAAEDHLFTVETGWPVGARFHGTVRVRPGRTISDQDRLLVLVALRMITEVGGKRRRGLGTCRFELSHSDMHVLESSPDFLQLFAKGKDA